MITKPKKRKTVNEIYNIRTFSDDTNIYGSHSYYGAYPRLVILGNREKKEMREKHRVHIKSCGNTYITYVQCT